MDTQQAEHADKSRKVSISSGLWPQPWEMDDDGGITGNDRSRKMDYKSKLLWNTYLLIE
jgi:hypothetical protein